MMSASMEANPSLGSPASPPSLESQDSMCSRKSERGEGRKEEKGEGERKREREREGQGRRDRGRSFNLTDTYDLYSISHHLTT